MEKAELRKSKRLLDPLIVREEFLFQDHFFKSGLAEKVMSDSEGMLVASFGDNSPNPDVTEVDACADIIRKNNIEFVVVVGGGSPMDCAKAAASVALTNDSIRKYHRTGVSLPEEHLPLIAIPTTAGTGSEVTCVSVLSDHANGKKAPIVSNGFYPVAAIIDPELTYTMPSAVTAGTGIDVLSHAIEGYWSKGHQPICDTLAIHAADLVFKYLFRAYENPNDKEAREKMLPSSFEKIHPKHKTPSVCIIFVTIVCCICPFFGREVIGWVVDMCSVGTAFGYFFTCVGAFILIKKYGDSDDTNKIHPSVALGGCAISVAILLLLVVPGSPAFMAPQSFIALVAWVLLGIIFYFCSRKKFMKINKREMDYLILGNVQVVRGVRKGKKQGDIVQGNVVNPKK